MNPQGTELVKIHLYSLLDLILTTDKNLVTSVKVSSPIDHSTIKFDLQLLLYPDKKNTRNIIILKLTLKTLTMNYRLLIGIF
jgi:hypothetical protein